MSGVTPRACLANQGLGALGEELAAEALRVRGWAILDRNWRCRAGEIDLVARDGECYVFVEVKTRHGHAVQFPEDALTPTKAARLESLAQLYLARHGLEDVTWRLDLVAIELDRRGQVQRLAITSAVTTQ